MGIIVKTMQKIKRKKIIVLLLLLELFFVLPSYSQKQISPTSLYKHAVSEETLKQYPNIPYNFIDLIKIIPKPLPTSLEKFQKIFNHQFYVTEKGKLYTKYSTGSFRTLDGIIIKKVGISVSVNKKNQVEGFYMDLDQNQCVNSNILKKEFGFLVPELLYLHPVPNAPIVLYTTDEWGYFGQGETLSYPGCATDIGIGAFSSINEKKKWVKYVRKNAPYLRARERQKELEGK